MAAIGFIIDLPDTWGIGSFATCQAGFKFSKSCDDETMPGTLNIAHTIPTILEFLLFLELIQISGITLIALITVAVVGAVFVASIVSKWSKKLIQIALGFAPVVLAGVLSCKLAHIGPFESTMKPAEIVNEMQSQGITITGADIWAIRLPTAQSSQNASRLYTAALPWHQAN